MTGALNLRVDVMFRGEDIAEGTSVFANVYPASPESKGMRGILIPAGDGVPHKRFDLPPGRYVVEAVLPSGTILTEEAEVAEGQEANVDFNATDSPHESHSWQYLAGNVEPGVTYHSPSTVPVPRSKSSRYFDNALTDVAEEAPPSSVGPFAPPTMLWVPDSRTEGWSFEGLNELAENMPTADLARIEDLIPEAERPVVPIPEPTETDLTSHLYRFGREGPLPSAGYVAVGARQFVIAMSAEDAFLVTLPNPWIDVRNGNEVQVELMVNARQSPTGSPVAVTVRDLAMGSGLAYLASGAFSAAARVFEDVEGMLYGKLMNPLAAAAGAYVLVGTERDREPKHWHDWLSNLRQWFGWMSDGSVLWAIHALRTAETDEQIEQGRAALIEAYQRGVPFFTLGLSWLIEGLSDFPDDDQCSQMLDQARRLSWRTDTRQPFVVLRLNGRSA